jgi:hypothetical protein
MFTQGILQDSIKYLEIIQDLNEIRMNSPEDFLYCTLIEIEININDGVLSIEANNFIARLTNYIKFPRNEDFKYANILKDKLFLTEFNEWLKFINDSLFNFEPIPIYDTSVDLDDYISFNKWNKQFNMLKEYI